MSNLPSNASLVQSLVPALRAALTPIVSQMSLASLLREDDRILRDAILEATGLVVQEALTEQERPANAAQKRTYRWHTALGLLQFSRLAVWDELGQWVDPVSNALIIYACSVAVREQICRLHSQLTSVETHQTIGLFMPTTPSVSTIHRVASFDGNSMAESCTPAVQETLLRDRVQAIAPDVSLIVMGLMGGMFRCVANRSQHIESGTRKG